jgi:hypothetical protein
MGGSYHSPIYSPYLISFDYYFLPHPHHCFRSRSVHYSHHLRPKVDNLHEVPHCSLGTLYQRQCFAAVFPSIIFPGWQACDQQYQ